jgi:hypothetical protein
MSQNSLNVPDGTGAQVRANINLALDTLNTLNSGSSAPANPEAYMLWADTGTGYLKQRDSTNSTWVAIRPLDPSAPVSTNSGNNYSITLTPAISTYVAGVVYKFIPNVSSTGACTLNINGLGAISINQATLQANQPVMLLYDATDGIFLMAGGGGGIPVGAITPYGGATAPLGWILCQGQAVSRTTYSALFAVLGTAYGSGDGTTTFNLPNLQQRFPLGKAASGTGSTLGATGGQIDHTHTSSGGLIYGSELLHGQGILLTTDNSGTLPGWNIGNPGDPITSGPTGPNNPPFQVVNYIIKY